MSDLPPAGGPAWLPDPTGRHEHRWFDGTSFTDRVADAGVAAVDPGPTAPPVAPPLGPPMAATPAWAPPGVAAPLAPALPPARRSKRGLVVGLAVVGVVLVGAGAFVVLTSGDDGGTGTFDGRLDGDAPVAVHLVQLDAGEVLTVDLVPASDLDAVIAFLVDDATADLLVDTYDGVVDLQRQALDDTFETGGSDLGTDADQVLLRTDLGFPGEAEQLLLAAPQDLEIGVIVGPFEPGTDTGSYEVALEAFPLDVGEDPDGDELLSAVADDQDVPDDFRQLADDLRIETG